MNRRTAVLFLALAATIGSARAQVVLPLASHRAAYEISLADNFSARMPSSQTPVAASGLIAYEFTGSACEGYASNFRQLTELQRSEGDPISSDIRALTFEDGDAKGLKFQIDSQTAGDASPAIVGSAKRVESGEITVALSKPSTRHLEFRQRHPLPHRTHRTHHRPGQTRRRRDGGARLRWLRHRQEGFPDLDRHRQASERADARDRLSPTRSAASAAGRSRSPISTKPPRTRRPNTSLVSISMRTAFPAR